MGGGVERREAGRGEMEESMHGGGDGKLCYGKGGVLERLVYILT